MKIFIFILTSLILTSFAQNSSYEAQSLDYVVLAKKSMLDLVILIAILVIMMLDLSAGELLQRIG